MSSKSSQGKVSCSLKRGWLKINSGFGKKSQPVWFEVDRATEYVSWYSNDPSLGAMSSTLKGTLNLQGSHIETKEQKKAKKAKYQILIKTSKGKKTTLTTGNEDDRDSWLQVFTRIRDSAKSVGQLLDEFKAQDDPLSCLECINGFCADDEGDEPLGEVNEDISYQDLFNLPVEHHKGGIMSFGDCIGERATIFLLMRHFGCMLCRHSAGLFTKLKPELDLLGIDLVAFSTGTPVMAEAFKKEQGFKGKIMVDQKRQVYQALNCVRGMKYSLTKATWQASKVAREGGHSQGATQGDLYQLGGVFVISKSDGIIYSHNDKFAGDYADVDEIFQFCKDYVEDKCDNWSSKEVVSDFYSLKSWNKLEPKSEEDRENKLAKAGVAFHIEMGNPKFPSKDVEYKIVDKEADIAYFSDFFYKEPHCSFLTGDLDYPIIISLTDPIKDRSSRGLISNYTGGLLNTFLNQISPLKDDTLHNTEFIHFFSKQKQNRTALEDFRILIPTKQATSYSKMLNYIKQISIKTPGTGLGNVKLTAKFYQGFNTQMLEKSLYDFEQKQIKINYSFGVLYVKDGQRDELDFYENESSKSFEKFLGILGEKVELNGFEQFSGGLDTSEKNENGTHSIFSRFKQKNLMFHVSTLLKDDTEDLINKKKFIGNDSVVIIFKEGTLPFNPSWINSHLNQVFIIVSPFYKVSDKTGTKKRRYEMTIVTKSGISPFIPFLHENGVFKDKTSLCKFTLTKCINAERTVLISSEFRNRKYSERKTLLSNIIQVNVGISLKPPKKITKSTSVSGGNVLFGSSKSSKKKTNSSKVAPEKQDVKDMILIEDKKTIHKDFFEDEHFKICEEFKTLLTKSNTLNYDEFESKFNSLVSQVETFLPKEIKSEYLKKSCESFLNSHKKQFQKILNLADLEDLNETKETIYCLIWEVLESVKNSHSLYHL